MAFLGGYSEDFDLDDDGILRDSVESGAHWMDCIIDDKTGGILIDEDGIVRDDFDLLSKHGSSTHWTDSGLGGDKPSSTPSTLRQLDLQSYPSFEDVSHNFDESNVNISDLEASKDDLSFDADFDDTVDRSHGRFTPKGNRSGLSSRSSFDHSLNYDETFDEGDQKPEIQKQDLFGEDYYRQLQELGVLVDEDDFANPRDSLQEFENLETHYSRDYDDGADRNEIEEFLQENSVDRHGESMDIELPDQSLRNTEDKLFETQGFDVFDQRNFEINEGKRTRPNTASSTRTISSRSFPEISPEEALELYTESLQSLDHQELDSLSIPFEQSQSQRTAHSDNDDENDDEIFFVASQENDGESPKPAKMPAYDNENKPSVTPQRKHKKKTDQFSDDSRSVTPQGHSEGYDDEYDRSRSVTPQADEINNADNGYQSNDDRFDSLTQVTRLDSRNKTQSESDTFRPNSALSEISSAASESRSVRSKMNKSQGKPPMQQKGGLSHAKSQESFFDHETGSFKKLEKGPKRLLPKPGSGEENQALKIKSKSATNLNAMSGPVKPTHMSLSEIRNIHIDDPILSLHDYDKSEPKSGASDIPKGELTKKLKQESSKRQQATHLVRQLQSDYDKLLSKYALAELTIDQMRLGAKISIHANSPTPSQATSGSLQSAQHLQMLQLVGPHRGSIASASPQTATPNAFFPETPAQDGSDRMSQHRGTSPALLPRSESTNSMDSTSTPRGDQEEPGGIANDAEKVKLGLMFQTRNLDERMQSFQTLLGENQLNVEEQENVFDKIRTDHEKLRRDYLQSKEDYNVLRRSTSAGLDVAFDQEKELEGELFKLGMKFDEIHETVDENLKEKSAKRQPFQKNRQDNEDSADSSMDVDPSVENMKKKIEGVSAGNDLLEAKRDSEFDKRLKHLHEEYNALMDRYRRLKQMGKTPEREKEIDNLVKKLRKICKEEPQIFRLPTDLQPGYDSPSSEKAIKSGTVHTHETAGTRPKSSENLETSDSNKPPSPEKRKLPQPKVEKSPAKSYEILTASETWSLAESIDRWVQSKEAHEERQQMSKSQDNLNSSMASNRSYRSDERDGDERYLEERDSRLQNKHRSGSYSSLSSRGRHTPDFSSHDRNSPVPSLPRPRRHEFPDRERRDRRELKKSVESLRASTTSLATDSGIDSVYTPKSKTKRQEGGSTTSLQDSGISEHEGGATGGHSGNSSPLSKLPGPGKFKQMTGRRELDTDSGFIGSMVGSEVSAGNLSSRRQPPQSPIRLRHPSDMQNQRPNSRQSNRSEDSARATTPRSARSVASSKSSRRTPTKAFPLTESKQTENEARAKTPTKEERKTPSRADSRTKTREQQTSHRSRDYTDDSYTSVTESDMSFDSDMRHRRSKPSSHNTSQRNIDKIMEDSEEEQYSVDPTLNETTDLNLSWITSDSERPSIRQSKRQEITKQTQKKAPETAKSGSKVAKPADRGQAQARGRDRLRGNEMTDESTTSTMSLTRDITQDITQDTTQDSYTSDETTPRSVIERERKQAKLKQQSRPNQETRTKKAPSAATEVAPPLQVTTPVKATRSEIHQRKILDSTLDSSPERQRIVPQQVLKPTNVDRSVGSGSEETILASDAETAATRGSVNSARLKLLSDEIGKLREEFARANNEKAQQQPAPHIPPALPQQQQDQYYDQYFDPTEDPLAFMRGPRRRANSFSGHGGRDWDYDWTLPNVNRDGDIPLGYAAADAYASPRHKHKTEEPVEESRTRGRHRLRRRIHQRNMGTQHLPEQNGYESDQSPTRAQVEEVQASPSKVQGHYGYYTSQPNTASPVQQNIQVKSPGHLQPGRRVFGSQPNLAYTGYQPPPPPRSTASGSTRSTSQTSSSRPLRQTLYSYAANPTQSRSGYNQSELPPKPYGRPQHRQYASDDIRVNDGQTHFIPNGATDAQSVPSEGGIYTSSCPLCGSSSYHSHGDFVYPPADHRVPMGYLVHDGRQIVESIQVPVYSLPSNVAPPAPTPLSTRSFRSPLPFRIYKAPPPFKPHLFPINIPKKITTSQETFLTPSTTRNLPMTASHDAVHQPIIEMDTPTEEGAGPRTRARSRSWGRTGRIRHYSPDGRVRNRYFVREYGNVESDSAESEEDLPRRRSRSVGRRRLRHGRKYRRVRGEEEYESDQGSLGLKRSSSQPNIQEPAESLKGENPTPEVKNEETKADIIRYFKSLTEFEENSAAGEDDLNRSLRLVGEIDELTQKMMGTVSGELALARRRKEFGSSVW